ncbi:hypothetical protein [Flavobacterium sp.]|uniref:hypothetical protein n=1 Tax=Flavobacterium sp. TaxID=239 RepID=UPI0026284F26|nr:hypothetical protein [Flavobacterium sp.]
MHPLQFKIPAAIKSFLLFSFLFFCANLLLSCNGNKAQKQQNHFKASIDLMVYRDNSIQLFYVLNADDSYNEAFSLRRNIKASDKMQRLVFELPLGVKAKNIRIDLGEHGNENDSLQIQNIRFEYKNRVINGNNGLYKTWFKFNPNVIQGKSKLRFHLKKVNGIFDPQLNGNRTLNAKLVKLFPPDIYEK